MKLGGSTGQFYWSVLLVSFTGVGTDPRVFNRTLFYSAGVCASVNYFNGVLPIT